VQARYRPLCAAQALLCSRCEANLCPGLRVAFLSNSSASSPKNLGGEIWKWMDLRIKWMDLRSELGQFGNGWVDLSRMKNEVDRCLEWHHETQCVEWQGH
jgi:hypothetical protein